MRTRHAALAIVFALLSLSWAAPGEARSIRHGWVAPCSVFDNHPCEPTFCSVFDRNPCVPSPQYGIGQDLRLTVESDHKDPYVMPGHDLDTIRDLFAALRACWKPPEPEKAQQGMEMSVRLSFKRDGAMVAPPRVTYVSKGTPDDTRQIYRDAITAAFDSCLPLHFTKGLGGAIAGRPIAIRYVDNRLLDSGSKQP